MKKKEFLAGAALLSISSAVCLKIMKKVGEKLKKEKKRKYCRQPPSDVPKGAQAVEKASLWGRRFIYAGGARGSKARLESDQMSRKALPCKACVERSDYFRAARRHKITTLFQAVEKSRRLFRQPGKDGASRPFAICKREIALLLAVLAAYLWAGGDVMSIGNQIMVIRREQQLTQEQFGNLFHVTRQTVSNWENGKSYPDLQLLVAISDQFGVSLDTLLKGDTKMVKAIDRERGLGVVKREKAVNHFFASAGTGLVASCVISPASATRTVILIVGFLMILIGWWRQSRWEEKMLSCLAKNQDEKT